MREHNSSNKTIAKNTVMLYIRMLFVMVLNLYISRIVLKALGVEDYGLYSVVGSVVSFLGFLNTSMTAAAQRFLTYHKGLANEAQQSITFNSIIRVQLLIGFIIFILCETVGLVYITNFLNVSSEKLTVVHIVFQFSIASILVNTIAVPYNASIIANERMGVFTVFSIVDVLFKFGVGYVLFLLPENRLVYYSALMFIGVCLTQGLYIWYCNHSFRECSIRNNSDKKTVNEILHYSWWNLLGSFSQVATEQGVNMVLNSFFGVIVNAARGISFQVSAAMAQLYSNFQQALTPQIVKSYASDDFERMHFLINQGTRLAFFLIYVFAIPIILNIKDILVLWLGEVPEYTSTFCVLVLINNMIGSMSQSLMKGAMATTDIKKYQLIVAGINLLNLPLSILVLKIYPDPYLTVYVMIGLSIIAFIARLILAHSMIRISISSFLKKTILPILFSVLISLPISLLLNKFYPTTGEFSRMFGRLVIMFIICVGVVTLIGVTKEERKVAFSYLLNRIRG